MSTGERGIALRKRSIALMLFVVFMIIAFLPLPMSHASGSAVVWTNKKEYDPSETAYIFGYGFKAFSQVNVSIVRPDLVEERLTAFTDEFGYFSCSYLLDGIHGTYSLTATDGINTATTGFDNCLALELSLKYCTIGTHIWAKASGLTKSKSYYLKYFDPDGVLRRTSPTYTGVYTFTDYYVILPSLPKVLGTWTVKLYENGYLKRTSTITISKIVWTTDSTYATQDTSFARGETVYFKAIGLISTMYYRFQLERPDGSRFYVSNWVTGVTTLTGSYTLTSTDQIGQWKVHTREAYDANGSGEHHYVDCCFEVTTPPPPQRYYLTVNVDPPGITTIPGEGWYNACIYANLTAPDFVPGVSGVRYRFDYWDVDGVSQGSGVNPISVHMDANHTATAHYVMQYYLNLTTNPLGVTTPSGIGWYDAGTNAPIFAPEFVGIVPGESRYRFNGWTTEDMSEIANASATSTTVFMDKAKTVTANYVVQYLVTFTQTGLASDAVGTVVTVNGAPKTFGDLPFTMWVDSGSQISYTYSSIVSTSNPAKRYRLDSVSGPSSPITVTGAVTVCGNYKTQYRIVFDQTGVGSDFTGTVVTVDGTGYTVSQIPAATTFWWDENSIHDFAFHSPLLVNGGKRYVWTSTSGLSTLQSGSLTVTGSGSVVGHYKTQYLVSFTHSGLSSDASGTVVTVDGEPKVFGNLPFSKWVDSGGTVTYSYQAIVSSTVSGKRYYLTSITGPASPITVTSSVTVTGNYKTQFLLTVRTSGLGTSVTNVYNNSIVLGTATDATPYSNWFDANAAFLLNIDSPISGSQKVFTYWSGDASGSLRPLPLTLNSAKDITANYKTQYLVTFTQSGLDSSATGTIVIVDGEPKVLSDLPFSKWVDSGTQITYSYQTTVPSTSPDKRFRLDSVTGPASPFIVTESTTITGNYVTQYQVVFAQTGLDSTASGTVVTVNGLPKTFSDLPYSLWADNGASITYSYSSTVSSTVTNKRFALTGVTGPSSPITVTSTVTVTGNYKIQYYLTVLTDPAGLSPEPSPSSGWYDASAVVNALAPDPSYLGTVQYRFLNWDVDGTPTSGNPIAVTMNMPHTVTAHYRAVSGPKAVFTESTHYPKINQPVLFNASASLPGWNGTNKPIVEYRWNFGDGNQTTTTSPIVYHAYKNPGTYYVTLTVYAPGTTPDTDTSPAQKKEVLAPVIGGLVIPLEDSTSRAYGQPLSPVALLIAIALTAILIRRKNKRNR